MSQHDHDIANASGDSVRADLNLLFAAMVSLNSGSSAPSPSFAGQWWHDTSVATLKRRNAANTVWVTIGPIDDALRAATETLSGILEIATQTETNTGTDDVRAITPLKLKSVANDFFSGAQVAILSDSARGTVEAAVQSEMEAASSTTLAVTPGRQHFHPSALKFWVKYQTGTGITASYNVSSVSDTATGVITVNIDTDFSGNTAAIVSDVDSGASSQFSSIDTTAAGSFIIRCRSDTSALQAPGGGFWHAMGAGDL